MAFDNDYKDWRKSYRGSKKYDRTCRNNGSCQYCKGNRLYNSQKRIIEINSKINDI